jgi:hypothetical protein
MRAEFFSLPLENAIVQEIIEWSAVALETPNPHFNGLPPCPYAKQAWLDQRVAILFKYEDSYQVLYSCISQFDDKFDLVIIVDLANDKEPEAFHSYWEGLNKFIAEGVFIDKDIWVMGFHPEDEPSEFVDEIEFTPNNDTLYSLIFVQRLSKLQEAADKLNKKGYYDAYDGQYNAREIYALREELYRRLKNGDETS